MSANTSHTQYLTDDHVSELFAEGQIESTVVDDGVSSLPLEEAAGAVLMPLVMFCFTQKVLELDKVYITDLE